GTGSVTRPVSSSLHARAMSQIESLDTVEIAPGVAVTVDTQSAEVKNARFDRLLTTIMTATGVYRAYHNWRDLVWDKVSESTRTRWRTQRKLGLEPPCPKRLSWAVMLREG